MGFDIVAQRITFDSRELPCRFDFRSAPAIERHDWEAFYSNSPSPRMQQPWPTRSQLVENECGVQGEFAGTVRNWLSETVYSGTWNTYLGRGSIP